MKRLAVLITFIYSLFINPFIAAHDAPPQPLIEEAFVAFATDNYFPILKVLIKSVQAFSSRKIVVFGVNADIPFSEHEFPCLIKKRIDVDLQKVTVFHWKPKVLLECGVKYGIYLDADTVVNQGIDNLFALCRQAQKYPLCPVHPQDPNDQGLLMKALGVTKKSMPYIHNAQIIFSDGCKPFFQEWLETGIQFQHLAHRHDEKVLNVVLWKHNVSQYTVLTDPYYGYVDWYVAGQTPIEYKNIPHMQYFMFHGAKTADEAETVLNKLIAHKEKQK